MKFRIRFREGEPVEVEAEGFGGAVYRAHRQQPGEIIAVELLPEPAPMPCIVYVPTGRPPNVGEHYLGAGGDFVTRSLGDDSRYAQDVCYVRREVALMQTVLDAIPFDEDGKIIGTPREVADAIARAIEGRDS